MRAHSLHALLAGALVSIAAPLPNAAAQAATTPTRVWEGRLTLPTYEEGMPDTNAPFDAFSPPGRPNYPYTIRDQLTNRRTNKAWRALFLENEFLRCAVLPDLGGHLYSCTDKVNGEEMFYANRALKFSNIAYRGSWAAFGIEFNFPVSHNWMTTSPVDYSSGRGDGGSAWIRVGNIDRPYGMEWSVRLTLRPGRSVLEQETILYNRDLVRHRFYWWTNAGVRAFDDSRIEYPMRFTASHGFTDIDRWPIDARGTDNSILRNHVFGPVSRFAHGSREGFMGVWHPSRNAGVAHFADPGELPAKKIWSWGVDSDALDWRRQLSDDSSAYVEIQAGLFRDQESYGWLEPQELVRFTERWLPVRALGGITRVTPDAILYLTRSSNTDSVVARLQVMQRWREARLVVHVGDQTVDSTAMSLEPATIIQRAMHARAPVTIGLIAREGERSPWRELVRHHENDFDFTPDSLIKTGPQPQIAVPSPEQRSDGDWLALGAREEVNGDILGSLGTYRAGLARFPQSQPLLRSAGRLAVSLGRWALGDSLLTRALSWDEEDAEGRYYRGVAREALGDTRGASADFEFAAHYRAWRSAAAWQLASIEARSGQRERAVARLRQALVLGEGAPRLRTALALLDGRKLRGARGEGAQSATARPGDSDRTRPPHDEALTPVERYVTSPTGAIDSAFALHLAEDPDRLLTVADELIAFARYDEAVALLSRHFPAAAERVREAGKPSPERSSILAYVRGYAHALAGEDPKPDYARAASLPLLYAFPHGDLTRRALGDALQRNRDDASARYLLGMLAMQRGETRAAIAAWDSVRLVRRDVPGLHRNLGYALLLEGDTARALTVFEEGVVADPHNAGVWVGLDSLLALRGNSATERAASLDRYPDRVAMPTALVYRYVRLLAAAERFDDAEALFANRFFSRVEGGTNPRVVWLEVRSAHALQMATLGRCAESLRIARSLGAPVPGLDFTRDGLAPFLAGRTVKVRITEVAQRCQELPR